MRLIDAGRIEKRLLEEEPHDGWDEYYEGFNRMKGIALNAIDATPTIDAVPVVRGEWKMDTDPDDGDCRCSSCKVCIDALHRRNHKVLTALGYKLHTFYKYCPNCGAKMESEA